MIVNFRARRISQGTCKLVRTLTIIKKKKKRERESLVISEFLFGFLLLALFFLSSVYIFLIESLICFALLFCWSWRTSCSETMSLLWQKNLCAALKLSVPGKINERGREKM